MSYNYDAASRSGSNESIFSQTSTEGTKKREPTFGKKTTRNADAPKPVRTEAERVAASKVLEDVFGPPGPYTGCTDLDRLKDLQEKRVKKTLSEIDKTYGKVSDHTRRPLPETPQGARNKPKELPEEYLY
jgi:hypothetical protein